METAIDVRDHGAQPGKGDATMAVLSALEKCRNLNNPVLVFPKGIYHFYPNKAREAYYAISNNGHGLKRSALPLSGFNGLTVDGDGSEFVMHGIMIPAIIDLSRDITLKNFSIDWERPFYSQGEVLNSTPDFFDIRIPEKYTHEIENDRLVFSGEGWKLPLTHFLEFDPTRKAPAAGAPDNGGGPCGCFIKSEVVAGDLVRVYMKMTHPPLEGNVIVLRCGDRHSPAVFMNRSTNVICENVTIHHAGGMAFIGQKCENITLLRSNVMLRSGTDRLFTAAADATHFVYCRGTIHMEDCLFENQLDDAGNVHGIYGRIDERINGNTVLVRLVHCEQVGVPIVAPDETARFVDRQTLLAYSDARVSAVQTLNVDNMLVSFDRIPAVLAIGDSIENIEWQPNLVIRGCTARCNRARGFLCTTGGHAIIENNTIETPGSGIKISGDANFWFESGAVNDCVIRNNRFIDCNYGPREWGHAVIDIDPEIPDRTANCYHRNIRIENNTFKGFATSLLYARSVDGISFIGNTIERTTTYPRKNSSSHALTLEQCTNVSVRNNRGENGAVLLNGKSRGSINGTSDI